MGITTGAWLASAGAVRAGKESERSSSKGDKECVCEECTAGGNLQVEEVEEVEAAGREERRR